MNIRCKHLFLNVSGRSWVHVTYLYVCLYNVVEFCTTDECNLPMSSEYRIDSLPNKINQIYNNISTKIVSVNIIACTSTTLSQRSLLFPQEQFDFRNINSDALRLYPRWTTIGVYLEFYNSLLVSCVFIFGFGISLSVVFGSTLLKFIFNIGFAILIRRLPPHELFSDPVGQIIIIIIKVLIT